MIAEISLTSLGFRSVEEPSATLIVRPPTLPFLPTLPAIGEVVGEELTASEEPIALELPDRFTEQEAANIITPQDTTPCRAALMASVGYITPRTSGSTNL